MAQQDQQTSRVLRRPKVQERTGLSKSGIYLAIQNGEFPRPIQIGKRAVGWLECDIEAWLRERIARRAEA
ncbi:hypothetical protein MasN3_07190 [Massilia varians]|uniref:AlpA family transcriptional regulator n=1 Tax=Massilia varians TaxID=457921 RepID=A0ABN6T8I0_9BURK|nr:AlpA family phage regulatory protein [Massilia varians]BDT57225.1 hypothetical protein MasN3_07190 [Massilia varians]